MTTTIAPTVGAAPIEDEVRKALSAFDELLRREPGVYAHDDGETETETETKAPAPKVESKITGSIKRPNGEEYIPRKLDPDVYGQPTDVEFIQHAYAARMPVLLYGPPGTGKTALFEAALPNVVTLTGTSETETADFLGSYVQRTDGNYEWIDGPLLVAAENGLPFHIDEIALIDPRALSIVYAVMDGRDEIVVTANPSRGTVKVKDGFMVLGACNPNVPGAIMSDALLSRFQIHVEVKTDWSLAKSLKVPTKIITAAKNLEAKAASSEVMAPPQLRELLTFRDVAATFGETLALSNMVAQARPEDRDVYVSVLSSLYGVTALQPLMFNGATKR